MSWLPAIRTATALRELANILTLGFALKPRLRWARPPIQSGRTLCRPSTTQSCGACRGGCSIGQAGPRGEDCLTQREAKSRPIRSRSPSRRNPSGSLGGGGPRSGVIDAKTRFYVSIGRHGQHGAKEEPRARAGSFDDRQGAIASAWLLCRSRRRIKTAIRSDFLAKSASAGC